MTGTDPWDVRGYLMRAFLSHACERPLRWSSRSSSTNQLKQAAPLMKDVNKSTPAVVEAQIDVMFRSLFAYKSVTPESLNDSEFHGLPYMFINVFAGVKKGAAWTVKRSVAHMHHNLHHHNTAWCMTRSGVKEARSLQTPRAVNELCLCPCACSCHLSTSMDNAQCCT